jgi:hypothetical protein
MHENDRGGISPFDPPSGCLGFHSITSSARASSDGGTARPIALAVLRLMINSNLVGCYAMGNVASALGQRVGFAILFVMAISIRR